MKRSGRPYWSIFRRLFARPRPAPRRRRGFTLSVPAAAVLGPGLVVVVVLRNGAP